MADIVVASIPATVSGIDELHVILDSTSFQSVLDTLIPPAPPPEPPPEPPPDPPPEPTDTTPPAITDISPAVGTAIGKRAQISFKVTDTSGLRKTVIIAEFGPKMKELVHDGDSFAHPYTVSSREAVTGGFLFVISRSNGWPSAPTLKVIAIDTAGNEV